MSDKTKNLFSTIEVKEADGQDRTLIFIGSVEIKDRDSELVKVDGIDLKNYMKNPVVLYAHSHYSIPVGKTTKIEKVTHNGVKALKFNIEFPEKDTYEFADLVYNMASKGFLNAVSIGFMPKSGGTEWIENPGADDIRRYYNKTELLEISICPVPSNPDALQTAKSFEGFDKYLEFNKYFEGDVKTKTFEELFSEKKVENEVSLTDAVMAMLEVVTEVKELTKSIKNLTVKTVIEPKEKDKTDKAITKTTKRTNLDNDDFWGELATKDLTDDNDLDDFFSE